MTLMDLFRPHHNATHPALARIAVNGFAAVNNLRRRGIFRDVHRQASSSFYPVGVCRWLPKPLPPRVADTLFDTTQVVNALAVAGIAHTYIGPANALLQLWTITYRNCFGMILHNDNMLVLQQIALGLAPDPARATSRDNGATITMLNVAAVAVYFISGVAKVRSSYGWSWAGGTALREQIAADGIRKEVFGEKAPAAGQLYRARGPLGVLAVGALAIELLAPLALLDRRLGRLFAISACAMHWGIWKAMGIKFTYNMSGISYVGFL